MGIVMANQNRFDVTHIAEFKENLQVLLIAALFILLGARLELEALANLGIGGSIVHRFPDADCTTFSGLSRDDWFRFDMARNPYLSHGWHHAALSLLRLRPYFHSTWLIIGIDEARFTRTLHIRCDYQHRRYLWFNRPLGRTLARSRRGKAARRVDYWRA